MEDMLSRAPEIDTGHSNPADNAEAFLDAYDLAYGTHINRDKYGNAKMLVSQDNETRSRHQCIPDIIYKQRVSSTRTEPKENAQLKDENTSRNQGTITVDVSINLQQREYDSPFENDPNIILQRPEVLFENTSQQKKTSKQIQIKTGTEIRASDQDLCRS